MSGGGIIGFGNRLVVWRLFSSNMSYSVLFMPYTALAITLNCFKLLGVITAGVATVLGTIRETKTEDKKKLTREGRIILTAGILGAVIAVVGQGIEWIEAAKKSQDDAAKNHELLVQISRSLNRLTDLSVDATFQIPLNDGSNAEIRQLVLEDLKAYNKMNSNPRSNKLFVVNGFDKVARDKTISNLVREDYLVDTTRSEAARQFKSLIDDSHVSIAIFKRPINPSTFKLNGEKRTEPDMLIIPGAGELHVDVSREYIDTPNALPANLQFRIGRYDMPVSPTSWTTSNKMDSLGDLNGAQVFVYPDGSYPDGNVSVDRFKMLPPDISLVINHHRVNLRSLKRVTDGQEDCFVTTLPNDLAGQF